MSEDTARILLVYIGAGLRVLSARLALLLCIALMFALGCWCMWDPTWPRLATMGVWGLLVFLPVVSIDRGTKKERAMLAPGESE